MECTLNLKDETPLIEINVIEKYAGIIIWNNHPTELIEDTMDV